MVRWMVSYFVTYWLNDSSVYCLWDVTVNIANTKSRTPDKGWSSNSEKGPENKRHVADFDGSLVQWRAVNRSRSFAFCKRSKIPDQLSDC